MYLTGSVLLLATHVEDVEYFSWISPWDNTKSQVVYVDWPNALGRENCWVVCPSGYFLNGLYKKENSKDPLNNIEKGRCVKPADYPTDYEHRYDIDTSSCFDKTDLCGCNTGYYVTGLYQSSCDGIFCVKKFRCSKLASGPEQLDELYKVKSRIMDLTMSGMAKLANKLGYARCGGCRSEALGKDFRRDGDKWVADKSGRCEGYMIDKRLSMVYDDWSFEIKDIISHMERLLFKN
ncbi:uncharacterized protein LOC131938125 [Physella acuta]|uniref:uncharacterized protein LOC131938125 n=1 Tax=Physella acuta TaxID=109671 RepID=UPI0027DD32B2|nr:uncharacterized protein LOC131938125 [Physella acuta]